MIDYGSVCSGIESVSVAVHPLGWKPAWFSEIEPFPSAVLEHRFPDVQNHGDMTQLPAKVLRGEIPAPAVLVGGTPCQAFSVAGMRQGLIDPRGALTIKFVELADAIDHVRSADGREECVVWWENVPGVLSDKGNAFGCFLAALVGESEPLQPSGGKWTDAGCVYGPQRAAAWRILDAQYFGLAQRRRRVFVVASARRGFDPASVLFESEGVRRDTAPRRGEGQDVAGRAPFGPAIQCGCGHVYAYELGAWGCPDCEGEDGPGVEVMAGRPFFGGGNQSGSLFQGSTLTAHSGRNDFDSEVFCVHGTQDPDTRIEQAHTLGRNSGQENAVLSVALRGREGGATAELGDEVAGCLRASSGGGDKPHVLVQYVPTQNTGFDTVATLDARSNAGGFPGTDGACGGHVIPATYPLLEVGKRTGKSTTDPRAGLGIGDDQDPMYTLQAGAQHGVCVTGDITHTLKGEGFDGSEDGTGRGQPIVAAFAENSRSEIRFEGGDGQIAGALSTGGGKAGQGTPTIVAFTTEQTPKHNNDCALTLTKQSPTGGGQIQSVMVGSAVRRLTPRECERLQGFPDDWTQIPWRNKPADECPDGPRYKAIGNSKAVPVVRWIARRIQSHI